MFANKTIVTVTTIFGVAVITSGLYRFIVEPGGEKGLWFGLVMGGLALLAAWLQTRSNPLPGRLLALIAACFVGGWFVYENFVKGKHELRMYLMVIVSVVQLSVILASFVRMSGKANEE